MADNSTSKNKQFLQKLERQRLNKICNRAIDLRGKVAGECQAYTFGDKTHYLDDRAYLIAKQLLVRFKGKYTIGVYESVLKVIKTLNEKQQAQDEAHPTAGRALLFNDAAQPQLISFNQLVSRQEARIVFATPIKIAIADVLYNGSTIDITTSAIRITLKRSYTLEQDNVVSISFPDFNTTANTELLSDIPYKISSIKHNETHTQAILTRHHSDDLAISRWLDEWIEEHNIAAYRNLDSKMVNLINRYYLRLYTPSLNSILLWLGKPDDSVPIKTFHLMPRSQAILSPLLDSNNEIDFSLLPIQTLMTKGGDVLVVITKTEAKSHSLAIARSDTRLVAKALNWTQKNKGTILLLHSQDYKIDTGDFAEQINAIAERDQKAGSNLIERLTDIALCVSISDISSSCHNTESVASFTDVELKQVTVAEQTTLAAPEPKALTHYFTHREPRFYIRTAITVHINGKKFKLTSIDASETGLSFTPPENISLPKEMLVLVDFDRWQSQTKNVALARVPYIIKNEYQLLSRTRVGLERNRLNCNQQTNDFFINLFEKNKDTLAKNHQDIVIPKESHIFSTLLSQSLSRIPLYFGMTDDNKRIIQAVASTQNNRADEKAQLWPALTNITALLSETLKGLSFNDSAVFGLYCYQSKTNNDDWIINSDLELKSAAEKTVFINRALAHKEHVFFQCSIMPLPINAFNQERDLTKQLAELRQHSPHKVKKIKSILQNLFAVGDLKDITDIIEAAY